MSFVRWLPVSVLLTAALAGCPKISDVGPGLERAAYRAALSDEFASASVVVPQESTSTILVDITPLPEVEVPEAPPVMVAGQQPPLPPKPAGLSGTSVVEPSGWASAGPSGDLAAIADALREDRWQRQLEARLADKQRLLDRMEKDLDRIQNGTYESAGSGGSRASASAELARVAAEQNAAYRAGVEQRMTDADAKLAAAVTELREGQAAAQQAQEASLAAQQAATAEALAALHGNQEQLTAALTQLASSAESDRARGSEQLTATLAAIDALREVVDSGNSVNADNRAKLGERLDRVEAKTGTRQRKPTRRQRKAEAALTKRLTDAKVKADTAKVVADPGPEPSVAPVQSEQQAVLASLEPLADSGMSVATRDDHIRAKMASDVLFASGSATLSAGGTTAISEIFDALLPFETVQVVVEGHTDSVPVTGGDFASNQELAAARANAVIQAAVAAGVPAERIRSVALGDTVPVGDNATPEGRSANRRIELVLRFVPPAAAPAAEEIQP